jgi:hypothetical protein
MHDLPLTSLEVPSDLLRWLAAVGNDPHQADPRETTPEVMAALAAELPEFVEATVLRVAPEGAYEGDCWLNQLAQIAHARRGCLSLGPGTSPWAATLALALESALALRTPAALALRERIAAEEAAEWDEGDDQGPILPPDIREGWAE